jgi:hypothetical protein
MSFIADVRKFFIPDFTESIKDVHERLSAEKYQSVKEFLAKPNPALEPDLFVDSFITENNRTLPVSIGGNFDEGKWVVEYETFGTHGTVHTRVLFSEDAMPTVDPFIIIEIQNNNQL